MGLMRLGWVWQRNKVREDGRGRERESDGEGRGRERRSEGRSEEKIIKYKNIEI